MQISTDPTVGMNVRSARLHAGLTLEQLAGRIGRSKGWLSMVENGRLALEKRSDIAAIAEACEVSADTILGQTAPEIQPGRRPYNLAPLRAVLLDASLDDPPDIPARGPDALGALAAEVDQALRHADYDVMYRQLPPLIGELHVCASAGDGGGRDEALRLLVQACASAMIMLRHFGRTDLAWISADRGPATGWAAGPWSS